MSKAISNIVRGFQVGVLRKFKCQKGVLYNCDYLNNHLSHDLRTSFNRIFSSNYRGFQPSILEMRGLQNCQDKVAAANFPSIYTGMPMV